MKGAFSSTIHRNFTSDTLSSTSPSSDERDPAPESRYDQAAYENDLSSLKQAMKLLQIEAIKAEELYQAEATRLDRRAAHQQVLNEQQRDDVNYSSPARKPVNAEDEVVQLKKLMTTRDVELYEAEERQRREKEMREKAERDLQSLRQQLQATETALREAEHKRNLKDKTMTERRTMSMYHPQSSQEVSSSSSRSRGRSRSHRPASPGQASLGKPTSIWKEMEDSEDKIAKFSSKIRASLIRSPTNTVGQTEVLKKHQHDPALIGKSEQSSLQERNQFDELKIQNFDLKQQLHQTKKDAKEALQKAKKLRDSAHNTLQQNRERLDQFEKQCANLSRQLEITTKEAQESVKNAKQEAETERQARERLAKQLAQHRDTVNACVNAAKEVDKKLEQTKELELKNQMLQKLNNQLLHEKNDVEQRLQLALEQTKTQEENCLLQVQEKDDLEQRLHRALEQTEENQQKNEQLQKQNEQLLLEKDDLEQRLHRTLEQIRQQQHKNQQLQKQNGQLHLDKDELEQRLHEVLNELHSGSLITQDAKDRLERQSEAIQILETTLEEKSLETTKEFKLRSELERKVVTLEMRSEALESQLLAKSKSLDKIEAQFQAETEARKAAEENLASKRDSSKVHDLRQGEAVDTEDGQSSLTEDSQRFHIKTMTLTSELEALKAKYAEAKELLDRTETQLEKERDNRVQIEARLRESVEKSNCEADPPEAEPRREETELEIVELTEKFAAEKSQLEMSLKSLKDLCQSEKDRRENAEAQVERLQVQFKKSMKDKYALEQITEEENAEKRIMELEDELAMAESRRKVTKESLDIEKQQREELEREVDELRLMIPEYGETEGRLANERKLRLEAESLVKDLRKKLRTRVENYVTAEERSTTRIHREETEQQVNTLEAELGALRIKYDNAHDALKEAVEQCNEERCLREEAENQLREIREKSIKSINQSPASPVPEIFKKTLREKAEKQLMSMRLKLEAKETEINSLKTQLTGSSVSRDDSRGSNIQQELEARCSSYKLKLYEERRIRSKEESHLERAVLSNLPDHVKSSFRQIGFVKHSFHYWPALILSPFSAPLSIRESWLELYNKYGKRDILLLYLYGKKNSKNGNAFPIVESHHFISYDESKRRLLDTIPAELERKLKMGMGLDEIEEEFCTGLKQIALDAKKPARQRTHPMETNHDDSSFESSNDAYSDSYDSTSVSSTVTPRHQGDYRRR